MAELEISGSSSGEGDETADDGTGKDKLNIPGPQDTFIEFNEHWNEEIALSFKDYLISGRYPDSLPSEKRRNFRKRANDFSVVDGELYYKKSGALRLALYRKEDCIRVFQVYRTMCKFFYPLSLS